MRTIEAVTYKSSQVEIVRDVVHHRPCLLFSPGEKVSEIVLAMHGHHSGAAGVVDATDRLIGLITEREILRRLFHMVPETAEQHRFARESKPTLELTAGDVMIGEPRSLSADLPVEEALSLITGYGYRYMPVLEGEKMLGIVGERELLLHTQAKKDRELQAKDNLLSYLMHHEAYGRGASA